MMKTNMHKKLPSETDVLCFDVILGSAGGPGGSQNRENECSEESQKTP